MFSNDANPFSNPRVLSVLLTEEANMLEQATKYYIISGPNSTTKVVFEVENNPQKHCGKPAIFNPTNYDSLYNAIISGALDLRSERNLCKERDGATQLLQHMASTENNGFVQFYAYNPKHTSHKTSDEDIKQNMEYEMNLGIKLDYFFYQSSRLIQASELKLLKNHCELDRTKIPSILTLSPENPRLAGYMLTGYRLMFLETNGSIAWLYRCPLIHSPLHTMNQCYERIPILYEGQIRFIDPITRQTHSAANLKICTDRMKNLFQCDMEQDSWCTLTPGIVHQDRPAVFGHKDISPVAVLSFPGPQDAGMYTRSVFSSFWDSILITPPLGIL